MRIGPLATILATMLAIAPLATAAEGLRRIDSALAQAGLEGVGRLDITEGGRVAGFCTAALVSPSLVLTAAHCVHEPGTGRAYMPERMVFRAALRDGSEAATRQVRRVAIDPGYRAGLPPNLENVAADLALLELDRALELPGVRPFPASGRLDPGDTVQVVSYARNRSDAPSHEDDCIVLDRNARVLALSCSVDFGSSGAPVFVRADGVLQIVSVISAKGDWAGRPAAFAVTVEEGLALLKREFRRAPQLSSSHKRLTVGGARSGSIRFLRPGE